MSPLRFSPGFGALILAAICGLVTTGRRATDNKALFSHTYPGAAAGSRNYLGFDRNEYPEDANLEGLRATFAYSGYWLNNPPGSNHNGWKGKRGILASRGFGFLVLFNGRLDSELKRTHDPAALGRSDAAEAVASARHDGFPAKTVIFLDVEEGGRMLPEQKAYLYAWVDGVNDSGFLAGVYCSGIPAPEKTGARVVTADDIRSHAGGRPIVFWVANDACPPAPGCVFPSQPPAPAESGIAFADVWQYAQSPRRPNLTRACKQTYAADANCYAPLPPASRLFLDLNTARDPDPSHGRTPK
jgi:hypothetical protein